MIITVKEKNLESIVDLGNHPDTDEIVRVFTSILGMMGYAERSIMYSYADLANEYIDRLEKEDETPED